MRRVFFIFFILIASPAMAEHCEDHAVLRDMDYFTSRYRWSNGRVIIKLWDSPAMIKMVGAVTPGLHVVVLQKSEGFLKIKTPDESGGSIGWISKSQIELTFQQSVREGYTGCDTAAASTDSEMHDEELPVLSSLEEKGGG